MAYTLNKYNADILTVVEDGTVDNTTDLKFIGKNYAGYGEIQNENFLFLLENFAGNNPPPRALNGQVWFDASVSKLKFYDGNKWRSTGGSEVATGEPTGLTEGDFWWDTINEQLFVYNGSTFVLIGPQNAGEGVTAFVSDTVTDTVGSERSVIKGIVGDEVIYILSSASFELSNADRVELPGFTLIKAGFTLRGTDASGVTQASLTPDYIHWGTASNALRLGGRLAEDYVLATSPSFTGSSSFPDEGFSVGNANELKLYVDRDAASATEDHGVIENDVGSNSKISFKATDGTGTSVHSVTIDAGGLKPATDNEFDLGTATRKWANVYATNLVGRADEAKLLRVTGTGADYYAVGREDVQAKSIAARTADGDLYARFFQGTATSAQYADLAEKYTTDEEYPVGTVMAVGGEAEARGAKVSDLVIGVVSEKPAYLMNAEADGQALALKGRVPVRVNGPVSKGQAVYAWQDGVASTIASNGLVGVALESNNDEGEKLVECVLKV